MIALLLMFFHDEPRVSVVTLDSKRIIQQLLAQHPSKTEQPYFIDSLSACLSEVVADYAIKNHVLILPSQASIAGNQDITSIISNRVLKQCLKDA